MSVEIDEATGFPELPEGYFWRITRRANWGSHTLTLISLGIQRRITLTYQKEIKKKTWFKPAEYETVEHEDSVSAKYKTWDIESFSANSTTRQNIILQEAAIQLLAEWTGEEERTKHTNSLMGDYPPKKLT